MNMNYLYVYFTFFIISIISGGYGEVELSWPEMCCLSLFFTVHLELSQPIAVPTLPRYIQLKWKTTTHITR